MRGLIAPRLVLAAVLAASGCISVGTPREGAPLAVPAGKALVFGQVTLVDGARRFPPANPGADWTEVGPGLRPELMLYLVRAAPRQVARPRFVGPGQFAWTLAPGDYLLTGSPADDADEPPALQHQWVIAALRVPATGIACLGALTIEAPTQTVVLEPMVGIDFVPEDAAVADDCAALTQALERRHAPLAAPAAKALMVPLRDLAFEDPELFAKARARLDAATR